VAELEDTDILHQQRLTLIHTQLLLVVAVQVMLKEYYQLKV
jgi:hypothetical protein